MPPAPAPAAAVEPVPKDGKVIFAEDFKIPKGWQGRYETIESPGCAYLGAGSAGIHMAFSPSGPVWREVSGFTPGKSYEISFEVRTLNPADAGKASFQIDDKVLHTISKNGKVSLSFKASQPTHRIKFDWKAQSIKMAPVHVTELRVVGDAGEEQVRATDNERYIGLWKWRHGTDWNSISWCLLVEKKADGKLDAGISLDCDKSYDMLREFQAKDGIISGKWGRNPEEYENIFSLDINAMNVSEQSRKNGVMNANRDYPLTKVR